MRDSPLPPVSPRSRLLNVTLPATPAVVETCESASTSTLPVKDTSPALVSTFPPSSIRPAASTISSVTSWPKALVVFRVAAISMSVLAWSEIGPAECTSASTVIVSGGSMVRPCEGAVRVPLISTSLPTPLVMLSR